MAALFDRNDVVSCEVGWAVKLADRLAECTAFQALSGAGTPEQAATHIYLGPGTLPVFAEEFSEAELANLFCLAQIIPQEAEGQQVVEDEAAAFAAPDEGATFNLLLRRHVRESELAGDQWGDVHNYLWDYSAKLAHELFTVSNTYSETNTQLCPRVRQVRRLGMGFNRFTSQVSQGGAWLVDYAIDVGDVFG